MRINPNFIHYLYDNHIVFISGSNLVIYNLETQKQKFLIRRNNQLKITYLSVGTVNSSKKREVIVPSSNRKNSVLSERDSQKEKDTLICLGEYSDAQNCFYITVIKPSNPNIQYTIKSTEPVWRINFATILNNSGYCITISQKASNSKKTPILSRLSFAKYTFEQFVSQENIQEELTYCCYNPKNTIELVVCGKGYLRLWNIFINEGSLKEHQQRFLRGKQEKEHTFIKAQFFDKKPFLLIVGTAENMFYIIDSFQVIHELNVCYSYENIYDLNVQNFVNEEEDDDIGGLKGLLETLTKKELDSKLKELAMMTSAPSSKQKDYEGMDEENQKNDGTGIQSAESKDEKSEGNDVFRRLYKAKEKEDDDCRVNKSNRVKYFELINDNLLFVIYQNDGILLLYKIDWNRKIADGETELDNRKWNITECRIIRVAKNIKTISNFSMYKPKNDIILLVESYVGRGKNKTIETSLFKMHRNIILEKNNPNLTQISFETKLFTGFFEKSEIKFLDYNEKKKNVFLIGADDILSCFDLASNQYIIRQPFNETVLSMSHCPSMNLIAISFPNRVCIYSKIKNKLHIFCELEVKNSIVKWSVNGDIIAIGGENRKDSSNTMKPSYCLYFIDTFSFNTVNVTENLAHKIIQLKFIDNDKYIFCLLENSYIVGFYINTSGNSLNLHQMFEERQDDVNSNQFKLIFTFNPKGRIISCFDYDEENDIVVALQKDSERMSIVTSSKSQKVMNVELPCTLKCIKLIKELKVLIGGDKDGSIKVYSWPLANYTESNLVKLEDNLMSSVNIHENLIHSIINAKNYSTFLSMSSDSCVILSNLQIQKNDEFKNFDYFPNNLRPQIEILISPELMYEMKVENITRKEKNVEILDKAMIRMKQTMEDDIEEIRNAHKTELENMESNLKQNTDDEQTKYENIEAEIKTLKENMAIDLTKRVEELEKDKLLLTSKYKEKIELYESEINRLKNELLNIKKAIEDKYEAEVNNQKEFYDNLLKEYNEKYSKVKSETDSCLVTLVNISSEYDEATDKIVEDYKKLVSNLDMKIAQTKEINENLLKDKDEKLKEAKKLEDEHKEQLEQKVKESDKLIEKNVEIKQSIINATQRTITFQEQLLETEKNLVKIDKKLEDLISKNKHLEQIRFVLEHRMTSLEKEKAPLEGQCAFLENQKNKLTEEFNKIILQINMHNQELENKQSQLRASLIQNYEIHDQKNYVETKLVLLKGEIEQFLMNYQDSDDTRNLSENKATKVAYNFKKFYDKYFTTSIEDELSNYQFYSQKLQEQTDKDGIANNFDLVMRNKAEEKLICEKEKVEELKDVKEKGFCRMQNENTILIAECNRLRKNLHEIYMHVVDIEQRFEHLTKINPKLTKSEIVSQIKEFIRATHEKIKENYSKSRKQKKILNKSYININDSNNNVNYSVDEVAKEERKSNDNKSAYENILKLPEIKNKSLSFLSQNKQDNIFDGEQSINKSNVLPRIEASS